MSDMRERTIHKLALIAARIAIKEALQAQGVKISYVTSTGIDAASNALYEADPTRFDAQATEFYDEFKSFGITKEPQS